MKRYLLVKILLPVVLFQLMSVNSIARNEEPNEIQLLVQRQIEEAKKKNLMATSKKEEVKPDPKPAEVKPVVKPVEEESFIESYLIKGAIMLVASAGVFVWLLKRKTKLEKLQKQNQLRKNIKLMREEKFIKEIDPKLKEIRTKLTLTSVVLNEEKKATAAARKSQIGKEEILLASRIRSHEMSYGGQRSFA